MPTQSYQSSLCKYSCLVIQCLEHILLMAVGLVANFEDQE
jgi:hypothetical protein